MQKSTALKLLSIREHSRYELRQKLIQRGFADVAILDVLNNLASLDIQSDLRFTQSYLRMRALRGYGPIRIQQELKEKGINAEIISQMMAKCDINWAAQMAVLFRKKFQKIPQNSIEKFKLHRFFYYRGFNSDQIKLFFKQMHLTYEDNE